MHLLLTILTTLLAGLFVVVVPGAGLLAWTRLDQLVVPPLLPAAAVAVGLVPLGLVTTATLLVHKPIEWVAAVMVLLVLACWVALSARAQRDGDRGLAGWARPVANLVFGDWARGTPWLALGAALAGGAIALLTGFHAWNDSLYHIGQAQKLLVLDAPSLDNTLQFVDGSAHPGYFLPIWQEALALTAFFARVDPVTASWILPTISVAIASLAAGGLLWVLTRARGATSVGAIAWVAMAVVALPFTDQIVNAMHPGFVAIHVLIPFTLAMVLTALHPLQREVRSTRQDATVSERTITRGATALAAAATLGVGVLHISYMWVLGMGVLGLYVGWLLSAPWTRTDVRRHLLTGVVVAMVAGACLGALLPQLGRMEQFGRTAQTEIEANELGLHEGENGADLPALLRGDVPGESYHLRADYLVRPGGLALLGLLIVPFVLLAPRWPGAWYLGGTTTIVLAIALTNRLFPLFVDLVTLDQARRIERVLPLVAGIGVYALAAGAASAALWTRATTAARVAAGAIAALATGVAMLIVANVPALVSYDDPRIVQPRLIVAVFALLLLAAVAALALLVLRLLGRTPSVLARLPVAGWTWPTAWLGSGACTIAVLIVLLGAAPGYGALNDVREPGRLDNLPIDQRTAELRLFGRQVAERLRAMPVGSIVLADPRSRNPYYVMAVAPVYVVASVPRHTAFTPENRVAERFHTAVSFFDGSFDEPGKLTREERIRLLLDEHVDAVVMHPRGNSDVRRMLDSLPGVRRTARGENQVLYRIDRRKLSAAVS